MSLYDRSFQFLVAKSPQAMRYNPGHWLSIMRGSYNTQADMAAAMTSANNIPKGVVKRWTWASFEPALDNYTPMATHEVVSDLDWCQARGLKLILQIEHRTFGYSNNTPNPPYLNARTALIPQTGDMNADGYTIALFDWFVVERLKLLLTQVSNYYGNHPALEGIMLEETALGQPESQWYTPPTGKIWQSYLADDYRDALIDYMAHWKTLQPGIRFFFYANYMVGDVPGVRLNEAIVASNNCVVTGPDAQQLDPTLENRVFHLYRNNKVTRPVAAFASTRVYPTAVTGQQIFNFATNDLGANYMMWVYQGPGSAGNVYWLDKARPTIIANPTFPNMLEDWT